VARASQSEDPSLPNWGSSRKRHADTNASSSMVSAPLGANDLVRATVCNGAEDKGGPLWRYDLSPTCEAGHDVQYGDGKYTYNIQICGVSSAECTYHDGPPGAVIQKYFATSEYPMTCVTNALGAPLFTPWGPLSAWDGEASGVVGLNLTYLPVPMPVDRKS
jgi:hypothetical protein